MQPFRQSWRQRWRNWWLQRHPRSDVLSITHRNLYILPTRAGLMLGVTLLLLLIGSINYQLNLGYLLTFLLAGTALASMHSAHRNLRGLTLHLHTEPAVFAGQRTSLTVTVSNPGRRARHGIGLLLSSPKASTPQDHWSWTDAPGQDSASVLLAWTAPGRGRHRLPPIQLESRFPMGFFRVWSWWQPAAEVLAYPAPENPAPPLPSGVGGDGPSVPVASGRGTDEYDGVRPYRRGDPLKWVVWKKTAKQWTSSTNQWISRDFSTPQAHELWLEHAQCGLQDGEACLSRLCAWVLEAEELGLSYGLRLPGRIIDLGHGPQHRQLCLEALALC